jgi:protoporphyrinogen oxidase
LSEADRSFFQNAKYGRAVAIDCVLPEKVDRCYAVSIPRVEKLLAATIIFHDFIDPSERSGMRATIVGGGEEATSEQLIRDFATIYQRIPETRAVHEWTTAMPQFPPGRFREIAEFVARQRAPGLFFCGDYLMGPFVEAAIGTGRRAAEAAAR